MIRLLGLFVAISGINAAGAATPLEARLQTTADLSSGDYVAARDALVRDATVSPAALNDVQGDWRVGLTAAAVRTWRDDTATAETVWTAAPQTARNGRLVFVQAMPEGGGPIVAERLAFGGGTVDERMAMADWLRKSDADFGPWVAGLLAEEAEPRVRAALAESLRWASGPSAVTGLRRGLADDAAPVRAASASAAGWGAHDDVVPDLVTALADADDEVAGFAARSLGWLGQTAAFTDIESVLGRSTPRTRLWALRALQRLDADRAASSSAVAELVTDPDARVSRAARRIAR